MPNVVVHERGCACLLPALPRPAWMDQECEARWEHDEAIALEMADGHTAHVVLDRAGESLIEVVPGTTEYGVRCSSLDSVVWWDVYTEAEARERMAEAEQTCDWPHLLVTREW